MTPYISFKYVKLWPNLRQFYSCAFFKFPHWNLGICLEWSSPYGLPAHYTGKLLQSNISLPGYFAFVAETTYIPFRLLASLLVGIFTKYLLDWNHKKISPISIDEIKTYSYANIRIQISCFHIIQTSIILLLQELIP